MISSQYHDAQFSEQLILTRIVSNVKFQSIRSCVCWPQSHTMEKAGLHLTELIRKQGSWCLKHFPRLMAKASSQIIAASKDPLVQTLFDILALAAQSLSTQGSKVATLCCRIRGPCLKASGLCQLRLRRHSHIQASSAARCVLLRPANGHGKAQELGHRFLYHAPCTDHEATWQNAIGQKRLGKKTICKKRGRPMHVQKLLIQFQQNPCPWLWRQPMAPRSALLPR